MATSDLVPMTMECVRVMSNARRQKAVILMKFSSYSSLSYPYTCMTNLSDVKATPSDVKAAPPEAIARWENEGGAPSRPERDKVMSRFVPPIVVPAFLIALIAARAAYLACS
jgi:hypothetical protein